ncbi:fungal specific transcription [Moniliophthora roreri]|nr:fungal specific transcription [Moniliophthora roreri]
MSDDGELTPLSDEDRVFASCAEFGIDGGVGARLGWSVIFDDGNRRRRRIGVQRGQRCLLDAIRAVV